MLEPLYEILPDENQQGFFRVAYIGNEYTVRSNHEWLHGLTKRKANHAIKQLEAKRMDLVKRLKALLKEYDKINPQGPEAQRRVVNQLSAKYRIGTKSISTTLLMRAGGINAGANK